MLKNGVLKMQTTIETKSVGHTGVQYFEMYSNWCKYTGIVIETLPQPLLDFEIFS